MNLEQIKSLVSVVNNKSFSRAAKEMYVTQPTISMHIKALERELGEQLLIRSTKDIVLSEAGIVFYPYAVRMLKAEEEALLEIRERGKEIIGEVQIASSSVPVNYMLPGFLAYARKKNQGIRYKITEGDSSEVIQKIMRFEQELGLCSILPNHPKCICEPLIKDRIVLITPNTKQYRSYNGVFPREVLAKENYVIREPGSGTKLAVDSLEKLLGLEADKIRVAAEVKTTETVKRAVAKGIGIAFISKLAIEDYVEQKKVLMFEFPDMETERQIYLIQHAERNLSRSGEKVLSLLREYYSNFALE